MQYTGNYFVTSGPLALVLALVPGRWVVICIYYRKVDYSPGMQMINVKRKVSSTLERLN